MGSDEAVREAERIVANASDAVLVNKAIGIALARTGVNFIAMGSRLVEGDEMTDRARTAILAALDDLRRLVDRGQ